ncbi:Aste57867_13399 [Aphanomyces stellatus]|uniref:Aste57867_13399 protein n=1 Tax=Aphanomyces stellatus TaxID=120398 RepID=A0A485KY18_9STRA|nr:hypothetical protein As57867_013349 [Aphanomyces stellatus]VFT90238.1 Aste57867_13399 [Aphanomyces stellatus]
MSILRRALLAALYFVAARATVLSVTVFPNGESTGGVQVDLTPVDVPSGRILAVYLSTLVKVDGVYTDETKSSTQDIADRVYTGQGRLVESFDDLAENDRLYVVAPNLLFVWPFVEMGHRVLIESPQSPTGKPIVLESFSDSPRVFLIHDFFTNDEADTVIERILAIDDEDFKLKRSTVGHDSSIGLKSNVRTSENAYDSQSDVAISLMKRSFDLLGIGAFQQGMADGLQLLRYQPKQAYIPHHDWFDIGTTEGFNWDPKANGANRFATVFLYLSNVTRGGQTVFPRADMPPGFDHPIAPTDNDMPGFEKGTWEYKMVQQCYSKMASYPRKTHAVLFYNQKGNGRRSIAMHDGLTAITSLAGELDVMSEHGGCPVVEGTKWAANLWVWNKSDRTHHPEVSLSFQNHLATAVDVYWSETMMFRLQGGEKLEGQISYGGQWSFRDADTGNVLLQHRLDMRVPSPQWISLPRQPTDAQALPADGVTTFEEVFATDKYIKEEL